ncbi:MAG: hypothetical protein ACLUEV_05560 [Alistipes sp.]
MIVSAGSKISASNRVKGPIFQNLTSFGVGYMTISLFLMTGVRRGSVDGEQAVYESELVRHVRFTEPLYIYVDGHKNKGIIRKG